MSHSFVFASIILVVSWMLVSSVEASGVRVEYYNNTAFSGTPYYTATNVPFHLNESVPRPLGTVEVSGTLSNPGSSNQYQFQCSSSADITFVWVDDHLVCTFGVYNNPTSSYDGTAATPLSFLTSSTWIIRAQLYYLTPGTVNGTAKYPVQLTVQWKTISSTSQFQDLPIQFLSSDVTAAEGHRISFQRNATKGWGTWIPQNMFSVTHLPDAGNLNFGYCRQTQQNNTCIVSDIIESNNPGVTVRPGYHRGDRSYAQYYYAWYDLNVSVEVMVNQQSDTVNVLVTPISCGSTCANVTLAVDVSFAYRRLGDTYINFVCPSYATKFSFEPWGLSSYYVLANATAAQVNGNRATFALDQGPILFQTVASSHEDVSTCSGHLHRASTLKVPREEIVQQQSEVHLAVEAAVMWNAVYVPAELGPVMPVSRAWNFAHLDTTNPLNIANHWSYVLFDWDNLFASYMAQHFSTDISISNFIQIVKAKTFAGFVPNYSAAGAKSVDRTEPPVGCMILKEMIVRDPTLTWVAQLLYSDLKDWHNWFINFRMPPANDTSGPYLVSLGTNKVDGYVDPSSDALQGARYESGLDNSPMYDGHHIFDKPSGKMKLFDVGMSGMVANEANALADIAMMIGKEHDVDALRAFASRVALDIQKHMWDSSLNTFVNVFWNGTHSPRVSPTTTYGLMANAATVQQVTLMAQSYLLNSSRFCLSPTWPSGQTDECFWGLPSISADDPAFPPLGYWRGYVWGPMAQLTYWSLKPYDSVPIARTARLALVNQMREMGLNMWRLNRHICENFNPHRVATDCTGTRFYHWGALTMFLTILEAENQQQ